MCTCYTFCTTKSKYIQKAFVLWHYFIHISCYILSEYPEVVPLCCQYWSNMSKMRRNKKWLLIWAVWRKITNIKSCRKRRYKRERKGVYVTMSVIKTKGLSKSIVTPLCFIEGAFEILRDVCPKLVTSERRTSNAWSVIPYSTQDFMPWLSNKEKPSHIHFILVP